MVERSRWFAELTVAETAFARTAHEKVERLLASVRPTELDRSRSTASLGASEVRIDLHHAGGARRFGIQLHYSQDLGGMVNPMGFEEYYQLRGSPSVEQDALDDLAVVLASTYAVEETWWRERCVRTVITQTYGGDELGGSVSGWPLLPPRWLLPRSQLTVRRDSVSYGGQPPTR